MCVEADRLAQRHSALACANAVRNHRARLKRDVRAGRVTATSLLLAHEDTLDSMRVVELLMAVPRVGASRARRILQVASVPHSKTIGTLSDRQRASLLLILRSR